MKQVNYNGRGDDHLYTVSTLFVHRDPVVYHLERNKPLIIIIIIIIMIDKDTMITLLWLKNYHFILSTSHGPSELIFMF